MRHYTVCTDCLEIYQKAFLAVGEIDSDLIAICTCKNGHKSISGLMLNLFDVLYSSAVDSYLRGCLSESVMSFAASLERTYEMFIKVTLFKEGFAFEEADKFWKEITNQSERQYGAFCVQYFRVAKKVWSIDNKQIQFRNKVIHKGYFAISDEVKEYAEYITNCHWEILKILNHDYAEESKQFYMYQKNLSRYKIEKLMLIHNTTFDNSSHPSLLNFNHINMQKVTFLEALNKMSTWQKLYGWT